MEWRCPKWRFAIAYFTIRQYFWVGFWLNSKRDSKCFPARGWPPTALLHQVSHLPPVAASRAGTRKSLCNNKNEHFMKPSQCLPAQKSGRRKIGNTEQNKYSYPHPRNTPKSQKNLWLTAYDSRRKELKAMSKSKEESIEIAITEAPKKTEWGGGRGVRHPLEIHIFREKLKKTLDKLKDYE